MKRAASKNWIYLLVTFFVAFSVTLVTAKFIRSLFIIQDQENAPLEESNLAPEPVAELPATSNFINLQPIIDDWITTVPGQAGVMIYDLDHDQIAASYNPDQVFGAASIYKMFFVYDGYQQIDAGLDQGAKPFVTTSDKGPLTLSACLDLMVRESYNGCADPMRADSTRYARVESLINTLGLTNTTSAGLYSTPADLTALYRHYWAHSELSDDSWSKIQDSMLHQPETTYDWRQGLPAGFRIAEVYDKVGWNWNGRSWDIYDDAAFVVFPELNRHYIVVIMTSGLPTYQPLVDLGALLESAVLSGGTGSQN